MQDREKAENEYKECYGIDLDWKTVPCVTATDLFLSKDDSMPGWGPPDGRPIARQVILCANSQEAADIEYSMKCSAKDLKLSRIKRGFGVTSSKNAYPLYHIACDCPLFGGTDRYRIDKEPEEIEEQTM